jgi:hypothetical protein
MSAFMVWCPNQSANSRSIEGSANWLMGIHNSGKYSYYNGAYISSGSVVTGTWKWMSVTQSASAGAMYLNGVLVNTNSNTTAPGTVGMGTAGSNTEAGGCYMAEMFFFNKVLSSTELSAMNSYIQGKYGL